MTQKEKQLLLKDLSARLSYLVKVSTTDNDGSLENVWDIHLYNTFTEDVNIIHSTENVSRLVDISEIKPYLRPMTSMTEEEKEELEYISEEYFGKALDKQFQETLSSNINEGEVLEYIASSVIVDWLNAHHFDYRGLIEKGLAIDATGLNIY